MIVVFDGSGRILEIGRCCFLSGWLFTGKKQVLPRCDRVRCIKMWLFGLEVLILVVLLG